MTSTATETRWLGSGSTRRKSMEPWIKDSVEFYPHQIEAIRKLARKPPSFILADDMGLGKSLQALTIFGIDVTRGLVSSAIIVCPPSLKGNWADEIEKFTGFSYIILDGAPKKREKQIEEFEAIAGPKILIVNYEQVIPHQLRFNVIRFDVAIFDEAHYLKNPNAKRTKASIDLFARRNMMLTGTPLLNRVNELWTLLHKCDPRRFARYYQFTQRYCMFGGYNGKEIVGTKNEAELRAFLSTYMVQRFKKDVLDLPDVQYIDRKVDMLPEQRKLYDQIINDMKLDTKDDGTVDIDNALTKFLRLKQICGTTFSFTSEDHSSKLDLAVQDAYDFIQRGEKVVFFTQFRDVQSCFSKRMRDLGVDVWELNGDVPKERRPEIVKEWASFKKPGVMNAMYQVAGVGLNMTASKVILRVDKLFTPGLNRQAVDRVNRIGASTTQPIQVFDYLCRGTIENRVNYILRVKEKIEEDILGDGDAEFKKQILAAMREELE